MSSRRADKLINAQKPFAFHGFYKQNKPQYFLSLIVLVPCSSVNNYNNNYNIVIVDQRPYSIVAEYTVQSSLNPIRRLTATC